MSAHAPHAPFTTSPHESGASRRQRFLRRWFFVNVLLSGLFGLLWLILRSGTKPSRLTYPCQQAALSTASLAFGGPLVAALIAAWRRTLWALLTPAGVTVAAVGLFVTLGTWGYLSRANAVPRLPIDLLLDYRAKLFHVVNCPQDPVGDRFIGLDNLLRMMGREGLKFYRSPNVALLAGPDGLLARDDTILVKINYQWPERGGTNTDLLSGLIRRIIEHPDGFAGEIVVCENAQFNSTEGFDRAANNAQNTSLSPHDVVVAFKSQGVKISHYDWTLVRYTSVQEYSAGNLQDGYVVGAYNALLQGRPSYPKFKTEYGTYVSLKHGLWDAVGGTYDREHLKFINVPVLKSHHSTYGATACVKHYMGVVTRELSTNSHSAIARGILGAVIGEVRPADLNILDCIWINANPYTGPQTPYGGATRRDQLVASTDPVATDIWAVKNILIPAFLANGYNPPWPTPSADPDDPNSAFRRYLDNSLAYIRTAGFNATNDFNQIDVRTWNPLGDLNCDGATDFGDINPFVLALSNPGGYATQYPDCEIGNADINRNGSVGFDDINPFVSLLAGP